MSQEVYKIFEEVEFKAKLLAKYWDGFHTEISQYLPDTYQPEMDELSQQLEQALENLVSELRSPTLTLATTGTTSSGKSTLVNLLCGAEIVPVAVSEMSAGVVTIEYSEEKSLVIHETPGAVWECGEWYGIGEEEIYQRLHQTMLSYIDSREQRPNLACPLSVIRYPFRLLKDSQIELPRGTKVQIMDLPGLAFVGDEGNANVIRKCREALCLVTYNSAETDRQKVRNLLQEVVEQVKDLGGSPARMLFVLNRIDVFRADKGWPETERRFVDSTISSIKAELADRLKEYTEEIEDLKVVKLSTWPALLALQIQSADDHYSIAACKKSDNYFNGLIEDVLEDLPRNVQKWSQHDRSRVAAELWQKSYAEEFQQDLIAHITQNFPQLVIPQIIERFNVAAGNAVVEWSVQTTSAILNSSQDHYEQECEKISWIRDALKKFLEENYENLRQPINKLKASYNLAKKNLGSDFDSFFKELDKIFNQFQSTKPYDALGERLRPLYSWRTELSRSRNQVLEGVTDSLKNGKINIDNPIFKKADGRHISQLEGNLEWLIDLGYTKSVAEKGEEMQAETSADKEKLKKLNVQLNKFSESLALVMEDVLKVVADQEIRRMKDAVEELFKSYLTHLENGASEKAPALSIKFPKSELAKVQPLLSFEMSFQSGFKITEKNWEERRRSFGYFLGIIPKVIKRSSNNATIPSVGKLIEAWTEQAKQAEPEIAKQVIDWLLEQIDCLNKGVDQVQTEVIDRYQARLDKAHQEITLEYENQKNVWQPLHQKAKDLAKEFSNLKEF